MIPVSKAGLLDTAKLPNPWNLAADALMLLFIILNIFLPPILRFVITHKNYSNSKNNISQDIFYILMPKTVYG
jgi:hypothetical protein